MVPGFLETGGRIGSVNEKRLSGIVDHPQLDETPVFVYSKFENSEILITQMSKLFEF